MNDWANGTTFDGNGEHLVNDKVKHIPWELVKSQDHIFPHQLKSVVTLYNKMHVAQIQNEGSSPRIVI